MKTCPDLSKTEKSHQLKIPNKEVKDFVNNSTGRKKTQPKFGALVPTTLDQTWSLILPREFNT